MPGILSSRASCFRISRNKSNTWVNSCILGPCCLRRRIAYVARSCQGLCSVSTVSWRASVISSRLITFKVASAVRAVTSTPSPMISYARYLWMAPFSPLSRLSSRIISPVCLNFHLYGFELCDSHSVFRASSPLAHSNGYRSGFIVAVLFCAVIVRSLISPSLGSGYD